MNPNNLDPQTKNAMASVVQPGNKERFLNGGSQGGNTNANNLDMQLKNALARVA